MHYPRRHVLVLGLALSALGLTASAQDAKKEKEKSADSPMERALEQSKLTGLPILAVAGTET